MILDRLSNASFYYGLGRGIEEGLRYLQSADCAGLAPGRHEIDGADLYAVVSEKENALPERELFEAHARYIDIQYVAWGAECMKAAPLGSVRPVNEFDPEKDYRLYEGAGDTVTVREGMFVLFAPQDAHMPGLPCAGAGMVKKVVVKVRV